MDALSITFSVGKGFTSCSKVVGPTIHLSLRANLIFYFCIVKNAVGNRLHQSSINMKAKLHQPAMSLLAFVQSFKEESVLDESVGAIPLKMPHKTCIKTITMFCSRKHLLVINKFLGKSLRFETHSLCQTVAYNNLNGTSTSTLLDVLSTIKR